MRKYLKYFIISLVLLFCYTINTKALDCYYTKTNSDDTSLDAHFRINDNNSKIVFSGVAGMLEDEEDKKNRRDISDNLGQKIENWNGVFNPFSEIGTKIDFVGKTYYENTRKCPPYVVVVDRVGQLDMIVADDKNNILESVKNYGGEKERYAVLNYIDKLGDDARVNYPTSCLGLNEASCRFNFNFACVWNDKNLNGTNYKYCNVDNLLYVACGDTRDIPIQVPSLVSFFVNLLKIATPLILIFVSIISLVKALAAQKEDEIKKAQSSLVKKIISAVMVFFVISIVQFIISKVADVEHTDKNGKTESDHFSDCLACFLNNDCEDSVYYKTNIDGIDYCTSLGSGNFEECPNE